MKKTIPVDQPSAKVIAIALFLGFLWGGNSVALKTSLVDMPPFMVGGLRFSLAILAIILWAVIYRIPIMPSKSERIPLLIMSLLFTTQIGLINIGTQYTYASHTTILININPLFTAVMAHFYFKGDELNLKKCLGLVVAFIGVIIVFRANFSLGSVFLIGDLYVLASAFVLGICNIYTKLLIQHINIYRLLIWQMAISLPIFFGLSFCFEGLDSYHFTPNALLAIVYQGLVVGGFCFVGWTLILKQHSPTKLTAFFFATPLFGVALSYLILNEPITINLAFGAIFVAYGIYLVNRA